MNTELKNLYTEVSPMAKWLQENFKARTKHRRLIDYMAANPLIYPMRDARVAIPGCLTELSISEQNLHVLMNDVKSVFEYNCKREGEIYPCIGKTSNVGLTIPITITQFYWDESDHSKILQFQGVIPLQMGDLVDFVAFPGNSKSCNFYVKDKMTQFDLDCLIIGYVLAVRHIVPIE